MRSCKAAIFVLLALVCAPLLAQEQVTVLKRDSTRFSGRFEAFNYATNTIYVRVSLNDQRIDPVANVLVVDVGGSADNLPAEETQAAGGAEHVLVLKSGEILRGRLINIEGGEGLDQPTVPRIVSFKPTTGDERRARMTEVRRLYLGNFPQPTAAPAPEPALPAGAIRVSANAGWVRTGILIRRGDRVQFQSSGEVGLSTDPEDKASPAGSMRGRHAPYAPAPQLLAGALIGRVGTSAPFGIGNVGEPLAVPGAGELFLAVNDDELSDNTGAFVVTPRVFRARQ